MMVENIVAVPPTSTSQVIIDGKSFLVTQRMSYQS
jgi:hypothetical protein